MKVGARTAAEVCRHFELDDDARALLQPAATPAQFLELLAREEMFPDAVRFLAHGLPRREGTWWACVCARLVVAPECPPADVKALEAAEKWVYEPTEKNRGGAMPAAEAAGFAGPGSWSAMAAFWSGGSIAPPDAPPVPPGEFLCARAVSSAVILAAVQREPERAPAKYRLFLDRGLDIARGGSGMGSPGAS